MKSVSVFVAAMAFGAGTFAMTRDAHALGPIGIEAGAKVGGATNPISNATDGTPNPLGVGLGLRGGVTIMGFYGGVAYTHYFGASQDLEGGSISAHTNMYGIDLGYGLTLLDILTIRAQVGIGSASFGTGGSVSTVVNGTTVSADAGGSQSNLYLEPGIVGLIGLGLIYVGADANVLVFPGLDGAKASIAINGEIGVKF
jgi:hypothetical protein